MDSSLYKDLTNSRGLTYHYYVSPATGAKPTLLLLHGFPSTSYDWRHQVAFFKQHGYGLIVPDLLGYGGTSKPLDPKLYKSSLISKDVIEILDAEKVHHVIAIGHDWGSKVASRLANYYPDRFEAYAFLAVSYVAPVAKLDLTAALAFTKKIFGYELFGYWVFFSEDDADKILENHWESFATILWGEDLKLWKTDFAPIDALKNWVLADKKTEYASWLTPEERKIQTDALLEGGLKAPLYWFQIYASGIETADDAAIPTDRYAVHKPVFYGAAKEDYSSPPARGKAALSELVKDATIKEFDAGHWLIFQAKDEVNSELLSWIEGLKL